MNDILALWIGLAGLVVVIALSVVDKKRFHWGAYVMWLPAIIYGIYYGLIKW